MYIYVDGFSQQLKLIFFKKKKPVINARRVCRLAQLPYKQLGWVQLPV